MGLYGLIFGEVVDFRFWVWEGVCGVIFCEGYFMYSKYLERRGLFLGLGS